MSLAQPDLFADAPAPPEGMVYAPDVLSPADGARLVEVISGLPFKPFDFHGYLANRQVVSFGFRYDYGQRAAQPTTPIPEFLMPLRTIAAEHADLEPEALNQAMINQYPPGAGIGWHRDKPVFGEVVGFSLLSPCALRFRRRAADGWERRTLRPQPRSLYVLRGPAREVWEHSIPPVQAMRYSITFRRYLGA